MKNKKYVLVLKYKSHLKFFNLSEYLYLYENI